MIDGKKLSFSKIVLKVHYDDIVVFSSVMSISYRTVPGTIWPIFTEFLIFCRLIFRVFRRVK